MPVYEDMTWRELLDDEVQGHPLRALCRAVEASKIELGGAFTKERFESDVVEFLEAGEYGRAAQALAFLCAMAEVGFCSSCGSMSETPLCQPCASVAAVAEEAALQGQD